MVIPYISDFKMGSRVKKMLRLAKNNLIQSTDNESTKTFEVYGEEDFRRNENTNSSVVTSTSRENNFNMVESYVHFPGFWKKENIIKGKLSQTLVVNISPREENNISTDLVSAAERELKGSNDVQLPVSNEESVPKNTRENFGSIQETSATPNISFSLDTIIPSSTPNIVSEDQVQFIEHEPNESSDKLLSLSGITFTDISNLVEGIDISNIFSFKPDSSNVATDESIISKSISSGESVIIPPQKQIRFHFTPEESNKENNPNADLHEIQSFPLYNANDVCNDERQNINSEYDSFQRPYNVDHVSTCSKMKKKNKQKRGETETLDAIISVPTDELTVEMVSDQRDIQTSSSYTSNSSTNDMNGDESIGHKTKSRYSRKKEFHGQEKSRSKKKSAIKVDKKHASSFETSSDNETKSNGSNGVQSTISSCIDSSRHTNKHDSGGIFPTSSSICTESECPPTKRLRKRRYENVNDSCESGMSLEDPFANSEDDKDYVPSSESHISDSLIGDINSEESFKFGEESPKICKNTKSKIKAVEQKKETDKKQKLTENKQNEPDFDKETITITTSQRHSRSGKRMRNKSYCCFLCHKSVIHLSKHLITVHSNETMIAKILALPKNSRSRRVEFAKITREGNFYHNCEVLQSKKGELILLRRPTPDEQKKYTYINYGPCPDCLGFLLKKNMRHHLKYNCIERAKSQLESRKPIGESNAMLAGINKLVDSLEYSVHIISKMRDDEITKECREDKLILKFGSMMFEKYNVTQAELIRQSMRQLGRLISQIKKNHQNIDNLTQCLKPSNFEYIIEATKNICSTTSSLTNRPQFKTPSLALKIGHSLRKCANFERGDALRCGDIRKNRELENFLSLMDIEWNIRISSNALNTLHIRKLNCTQLLPITNDLIKLNKYIEDEMKRNMNQLQNSNEVTPNHWATLASLTLSRIVIFNKRRSGEMARMTIDHYTMRPLWSEQTTAESRNALSEFEKRLANHFCIVEIPGKRGKKVPVLLSPEMKTSIDLLLKTRTMGGISKENPFVFARAGNSLGHMRGHDCIRKCIANVDLQMPENINGTKLRKYIATVSQIMNMTENETDWLARHLGHDIRIHREFYRLHESAVELTKISRLLMAIDNGEAYKFHGKKLNEIELTGNFLNNICLSTPTNRKISFRFTSVAIGRS